MLLRAIFYAAGKEDLLRKWFSSNQDTECSYYPDTGNCAVINNSSDPVSTYLYNGESKN